jgi:hypothetical protein
VGEFLAKTEDEYKEYMKRKFLKEQWDNAVVLYRLKQKANDKEGMRQVLERISIQLKSAELSEMDPRRSTTSESISRIDPHDAGGDTEADLDKLFKELKEENKRSENPQDDTPPLDVPPNTTNGSPPPPLPVRSSGPTISEPPDPTTAASSSSPPSIIITTENDPDYDNDSWQTKWYRSTLYNTFFSRSRRRILFIPTQIIFLIMIIISTAVSTIAAAVLCGILGGLLIGGLSAWIIWSFRNNSKGMTFVIGFLAAEGIAELFSIIGGFANNGNYIIYLGIPAIILVIFGTILAYIGIVKGSTTQDSSRKSEIV